MEGLVKFLWSLIAISLVVLAATIIDYVREKFPSWQEKWKAKRKEWQRKKQERLKARKEQQEAEEKARQERLNKEAEERWRRRNAEQERLWLEKERQEAKSKLPLLSSKIAFHCLTTYLDLQEIEPPHVRKMMMLTTILDYYKIHEITGRNLEALAEDIYKEATDSLFPKGLKSLMEKHVISLVEHTIVRYLSARFKWELTYLERRVVRKTVRKMVPPFL